MKTDAQIKKDILDELVWDPAVSSTDIGVIVKDGVVTLTGHLSTLTEKLAAEQAAHRVSGVKAVAIEMDVRLRSDMERSDAEIAVTASSALGWTVTVPQGKVRIAVEKGWVSLSGEVDWEYQRSAAENVVQNLLGVVGVTNHIQVKPRVSTIDIQNNIEGALTRQAIREAKHLQVLVDGSCVTLKGTVHSWAERQAAQGAAWSAPGVTRVSNQISLS